MLDAFEVPLLRRSDLSGNGVGPRALQRMLASAELIRLRSGVYVAAADAASLTSEQLAVLAARALAHGSTQPPVASHVTAAALHGLPLWATPATPVHVTLDEHRPRTGAGTVRHRGPLPAGHIVRVHEVACTSLARTVADVARTAAFETAVCIADAALRTVSGEHPARADLARGEELRQEAAEIARTFAHGVSRAERVLAFADARAQLPGESISRIRLHQLGFRRIRLQVALPAPRGRQYFADFALDEASAFGEFDGRGKYGTLTTVAQVLDAEKQREDWIRGTTGWAVVRWGFAHLATPRALGDRLRAFGVRPPG